MSENESETVFCGLFEVKHRIRDFLKCNIVLETLENATPNRRRFEMKHRVRIFF